MQSDIQKKFINYALNETIHMHLMLVKETYMKSFIRYTYYYYYMKKRLFIQIMWSK